jgi:hypothetical protein
LVQKKFIAYGTHVGHGIGRCTKAEATNTGTQHGSIVIATQQREGYKKANSAIITTWLTKMEW